MIGISAHKFVTLDEIVFIQTWIEVKKNYK